jgi:hypothetical protein
LFIAVTSFQSSLAMNPCIDSLVGFSNEGEGVVLAVPEKLLQQTQCSRGEHGFDIEVS